MKEKTQESILTCYLLNSPGKVVYLPQALKIPWLKSKKSDKKINSLHCLTIVCRKRRVNRSLWV